MNYAIKTPTGELHRVVLAAELPAGKTLAELDLLPVDPTIPDGYRQDFSRGPKTARGWQLVAGVVVPYITALHVPTQEEKEAAIAEEAERGEWQQLVATADDMLSGTGTQTERMRRVEIAIGRLLKRLAKSSQSP